MTFSVAITIIGDSAAVVAIAGEADLYTAPQLRAALVQVMDQGCRGVLVDLTRATFIDSSTLGVLMGALGRLQRSSGGLAIACPDSRIRHTFEITMLDQVFPIFDARGAGEAHIRRLAAAVPA